MRIEVLKGIAVAAEVTGTVLSEAALEIIEADLREYPEDEVLDALVRVRRECRGRLTLADIISKLQGAPVHDLSDRQLVERARALGVSTSGKGRDALVRDVRAKQDGRQRFSEREEGSGPVRLRDIVAALQAKEAP